MKSIVSLTEKGQKVRCSQLGAKCANIYRLWGYGMDVPQSFAVSPDSCAEHLAPLARDIEDTLKYSDPQTAEQRISKMILAAEPAPEQVRHLENALDKFPSGTTFAVRSSGSINVNGRHKREDSSGSSLAGMFSSYLPVPRHEVVRATARCWASLYKERNIRLFAGKTGQFYTGSMSVLVQEMIPAVASAVLMTKDPVDTRNALGIEFTHGPCKALVSGEVTPDFCLIDRDTRRIIKLEIGTKSHRVAFFEFSGMGKNYDLVENERRNDLSLEEPALKVLADLGMRIEHCFGTPMEVEAIWNGNRWTFVQARPITTLN